MEPRERSIVQGKTQRMYEHDLMFEYNTPLMAPCFHFQADPKAMESTESTVRSRAENVPGSQKWIVLSVSLIRTFSMISTSP